MDDSFSQDTLETACISQTIDEFTQLQQVVRSASNHASSAQQNVAGGHHGNENNRHTVTQQGHVQGHTSTSSFMNFQHNSSIDTESVHMQGGQVVTPHYVIVEDPISLHSYADFSSPGILPGFGLQEEKDQSVIEKTVPSNSFEMYMTTQTETGTVSSVADMKTTVTEATSARKETILTVPVIDVQKSQNNQVSRTDELKSIGNQRSVTLTEVREQLKEHLSKKEAESLGLRKLKLTTLKEQKNDADNSESDGSIITAMLTKNSIDDIKISQVSSLSNTEACTDTEDHMTLLKYATSDNEKSVKNLNTQERTAQEKTTFSENLGLIPAESEIKIKEERARNASKGVRTRKSLELGALTATVEPVTFPGLVKLKNDNKSNDADTDESLPMVGHKHRPGCYRCGSCTKTFMTICKLHDHLQDHCFGGSYHYDHLLKTAFPKYDTTCSYSQTNYEFDKEQAQKILKARKGKLSFKLKAPKKLKIKTTALKSFVPAVGKRKRGRPRKIQVVENNVENEQDEDMEVQNDFTDDNEELVLKEEPVAYNIDGTPFDNGGETESKMDEIEDIVEESFENIDGNKKATSDFVDNYLKNLEDDIDTVAPNEPENEKKKARKRKSSIPRKIMVNSESESGEKIVNSRVKPEMKITCEFCPSKFQYTRGLIRHEQEKHADQMKFNCDECDQKFMREYNLERHKLCSHTVGKSKFIQQRKGIYREKKKPGRRPLEKSPESAIPCEICGIDVPSSKLDIHIRLHTGERPYICHVCGKGLISDKKLKRHLLIHSEVQRHTCDVCGQGFSMKYKLRTHMFVHTGHKPYLCSVCGAEFNNSTSLLHHNRTVHLGDKRYECTVCGGRYGKKSQLEEHMFSHSSERTQTCKFCGKTFKHAKSLRRHEFTHVSNQKFQCDQCESKFSRKDNLERHKMCHYEATLQCSFCKKKFRERQPLIEHEQFHVNQRKNTCQICKERFQDENYFLNHMEKNHGITRDMVPMINALATSPVKEGKSRKSGVDQSNQSLIIDPLKASTSSDDDQMGLSVPQSTSIDTLNLSMSVAGILPTSEQDLGNGSQSNMQSGSLSLNNLTQQVFNVGTNTPSMNMNVSRGVLNQSGNASIVSSGGIFPVMNEAQRIALNVMNAGLDQSGAGLALAADSLLMPDQQRMIQDVVGPSLPNMQGQGYRLQNLFNQ